MTRGDHRATRHVAVSNNLIEIEPDEFGDEQKQTAEFSVQSLRCQMDDT